MSRHPEIIAEAVYQIVSKPSTECTGNAFIDEELLALAGIDDLSEYAVVPGGQLYPDLFL